ncbi:sulfite exporter TauE/SafE family protein [Cellvibrio japonicus]|nr:sulfite exporter TauE/SafE family protein [Cellvibrio japonicus]QEI11188.1 sulfite exporter TauE/SafE family protein [Cellvibrio japonicus]QEI14762.1 sulfite exporter TauE/SafE family protein [Cellvibrio japonicus]QEI18342.1 sulfite exporter TauE/SafE family protein [Cellvibrio japonicus]
MDFHIGYIVAGLVVGFIVGMTGVGGGSLMTPILLYFGVSPANAVGTDLLYAAITKAGGIHVHHKKKNIDWRITGELALGSLPAAALTLLVLHSISIDTDTLNKIIKLTLGYALILTAIAILFKRKIFDYSRKNESWITRMTRRQQFIATVLTGVILGVVVTITSIGAGALGTVALFMLYPLLPTVRLVGTEIAHAVPLTLVAGMGHAGLGNVDWSLLANLLMGSLPGIYMGSHLANRVADHYLRPALAIMLMLVGCKLVF